VLGDPGELPARCARVLAEGPPPLTEAERDGLRYGLTDVLDDFTHVVDPGERTVIASVLWFEAGKAALAFAGRWVSGGKWLLRELRELDPDLPRGGWPLATNQPSSPLRSWPTAAARCSTAIAPERSAGRVSGIRQTRVAKS